MYRPIENENGDDIVLYLVSGNSAIFFTESIFRKERVVKDLSLEKLLIFFINYVFVWLFSFRRVIDV